MKKQNIPVIETPKEWETYHSVKEALDYFSEQEYAQYPVSLGECKIDEDGVFTAAGEKMGFTELSLNSLLKRLKIPKSFVQRTCPLDLAVTNVNHMLQQRKNKMVTCWCNATDNTLEAVTEIDFKPIRHRTFLNAFAESFQTHDALEIRLSVTELRVVRLFEFKTDPVPGDFFQFGVEFINYDIFSEVKFLQADAFLYRLVCSNGSKVGQALQDYQGLFKPPVTDTFLQDKMKAISYSEQDTMNIVSALKWMGEHEISSHRHQIFDSFQKMAQKYIPMPDENPFVPDDTYYDIFNHVTQAVQNRNMPFIGRRRVETWAGSIIDAYIYAVLTGKQRVIWEDTAIPLGQ